MSSVIDMEQEFEAWQEQREQFSKNALPDLEIIAEQIEAMWIGIFVNRVTFTPGDGAEVMLLSFVTKQREHLKSVRVLIERGQHRDALLIARTMLEGLGVLLWAYNGRPERTDRWYSFGVILDWRQMVKNERNGVAIDPEERAEFERLVNLHGAKFVRDSVEKETEKAARCGAPPPVYADPWVGKWCETSVETMFQKVKGSDLYEEYYRIPSEWVHWGPRAINRAMEFKDWGVAGFSSQDWLTAATALYIGCRSLIESLMALDTHFELGLKEEAEVLLDRLVAVFDNAPENPLNDALVM